MNRICFFFCLLACFFQKIKFLPLIAKTLWHEKAVSSLFRPGSRANREIKSRKWEFVVYKYRPYSRCPPTLHTHLRTGKIKAMPPGFSGSKTICQYKKSCRVCFFCTTENYKKTFCFNDNNGKLRVEVIIVAFFGCSSDCICPNSKQ